MKIASISVFQHDLRVKNGPYTMSYGEITALDTTLVKLVTDTGVTGWGETCPLGPLYAPAHADGARTALSALAPGLIGTDVLSGAVMHQMDGLLNGHAYAKAAIDIAVYDALGKSVQKPVTDLLGGALRKSVPSYYAIGIETPDTAARIAREKRREGYQRLQLKVGAHSPEVDIEIIHRVGQEIAGSGMRFAVDANRGWTTRDAIFVSQACRAIPMIIEQPCKTVSELIALRPQLAHPLYMDENSVDLDRVIQAAGAGFVDGFGFKLTRLGGLTPMSTARDICAARNLPHTVDDAWGGDLLAAACVHMGATVRADLFEGTWIAAPYIDGHYDAKSGPRIEDGHIAVPEGDGLGVTPDEGMFGAPVFAT
ncbi:mandelate racemase/muconate lactonizing enzyme family protein [Cognatishimia sp.]|uniref:mandelate racemase/muconate lactonizing enzyme family protein n=1 Tax=Cognatishimia sp. TaxID=2211648 RepID=UPI0035137D0A